MNLLDETLQIINFDAGGGLPPAFVLPFGHINVQRFQRVRGSVVQGVGELGTLLIEFFQPQKNVPAPQPITKTAEYAIPIDVSQAWASVYSFDIVVLAPYVQMTWTNGGAPGTLFRAHLEALPT